MEEKPNSARPLLPLVRRVGSVALALLLIGWAGLAAYDSLVGPAAPATWDSSHWAQFLSVLGSLALGGLLLEIFPSARLVPVIFVVFLGALSLSGWQVAVEAPWDDGKLNASIRRMVLSAAATLLVAFWPREAAPEALTWRAAWRRRSTKLAAVALIAAALLLNPLVLGLRPKLLDPRFDVEHSLRAAPFDVRLADVPWGASIAYTLDGSSPLGPSALSYSGAIHVRTTSVLRAVARRFGSQPSRVVTQTYVFPRDVAGQSNAAAYERGWPKAWSKSRADYDMSPQVLAAVGDADSPAGKARYLELIDRALHALPTLSLCMEPALLFGEQGVYVRTEQRGAEAERPCSFELLDDQGGLGVQTDAGFRMHGNTTRFHQFSDKHSMRIVFRSEYGIKGLVRPQLFGDGKPINVLVLRACGADSWSRVQLSPKTQYLRDEFARRMHRAMGRGSPQGALVHVCLNGLYWGMYNAVERPDKSYASERFGGKKDDWDVIRDGQAGDGDTLAWDELLSICGVIQASKAPRRQNELYLQLQGRRSNGSRDPSLPVLLDVDDYIDYMLLNLYLGNADWPLSNFVALRRRDKPKEGFRFICWDSELSLDLSFSVDFDHVKTLRHAGVAKPFHSLQKCADFRRRFQQRARKHFAPGGALYVDGQSPAYDPTHPDRNVPAALYASLAESVQDAILAEAARWGDQAPGKAKKRDAEWAKERDYLLKEYFPRRSAIVVQHLRQAGLYPDEPSPGVKSSN